MKSFIFLASILLSVPMTVQTAYGATAKSTDQTTDQTTVIQQKKMSKKSLMKVPVGKKSTTVTKKVAAAKAKPSAKTNASGAKLGTSFKFDGTALRGKYQSSLNTAATVENDKSLDDLLGGRTQFEDRIQKDQKRN